MASTSESQVQAYEWIGLSLSEASDLVAKRRAIEFPLGAMLGGTYGIPQRFYWFSCEAEMFRYIEDVFAIMSPDLDEDSFELVREVVGEILQERKKLSLESLRDKLESFLFSSTEQTMIWMGTFDELCLGENEFTEHWNKKFRGKYPGRFRPVLAEEKQAFSDFLWKRQNRQTKKSNAKGDKNGK